MLDRRAAYLQALCGSATASAGHAPRTNPGLLCSGFDLSAPLAVLTICGTPSGKRDGEPPNAFIVPQSCRYSHALGASAGRHRCDVLDPIAHGRRCDTILR